MSIDPNDPMIATRDPDTQPIPVLRTGERQRAAIALGVLAIAALVVVGIMVVVLGSNKTSTSNGTGSIAGPGGPAVTVTGGAPSNRPTAHKSKPAKRHTSKPPVRPRSAPVSCPTSSPCDLTDDVGNAIGALNAFRSSHGKAPVVGRVTQAARTCAVSSGNTCPNGFFWEPVGRSGKQVIQKIAASGSGLSWLLGDGLKTVQVGWAYIPSSHSFECALISNAG